MRTVALLAVSLMLLASPIGAAPSVSVPVDQVQLAISDILRQEGFEPSTAAALAARIAEKLAADSEPAGPTLRERAASPAPAGWQDALAVPPSDGTGSAVDLSPGAAKTYPENVANFVIEETEEAARIVILRHLKQIETSGSMSVYVATDRYWRDVFVREGYGDVYITSRDLLKKALRAGLRPYKQGRGLDAKVFAQLATRALEPTTEVASSLNLSLPAEP